MCELTETLERKIGYTFKNKELLRLALTHSSYNSEKSHLHNYERLEFLGDSILGFAAAEYFYHKLSDRPEGELTKIRANAVCEKSLASFAADMGLGEFLLMSRGEDLQGGRNRPSILADAVEAIIAAVYLDGGMEAAKKFALIPISSAATDIAAVTDYKTMLQEIIQKNPDEQLRYILAAESGPDHMKSFTVEVYLNSNLIGTGVGHSKKKAEQAAAREALSLMGITQ